MSSFFSRFRGRNKEENVPATEKSTPDNTTDTPVVATEHTDSAKSAQSATSADDASAPEREKTTQASEVAPSSPSAQSTSADAKVKEKDAKQCETANDTVEEEHVNVEKHMHEDVEKRDVLLARAYARWLEELTQHAQKRREEPHVVIDLTHPHPTGGAQFASGSPTRITSLIREEHAQAQALSSLAQLRTYVGKTKEIFGYAPIHLAVGELTWTELPKRTPNSDIENSYENTGELKLDPQSIRDRELDAASAMGLVEEGEALPVTAIPQTGNSEEEPLPQASEVKEAILFREIDLEDKGDDAVITPTPNFAINQKLVDALRHHGTPIRELGKLSSDSVVSEDELIMRVRQLAHTYLPGASYRPMTLMGVFNEPTERLLTDFIAMKPMISQSGLLCAVAGDEALRQISSQQLPPASDVDRDPESERGVGDLDVEEIAAVEAVASGRNIVINTPPGSHGLSVLVSIVADAAASGRSVLYVPASPNRMRAFLQEAERAGVDDMVFDVADTDNVAMRLRTGWRQEFPFFDEEHSASVSKELKSSRRDLTNYLAALHSTDPVWKTSVFDIIQHLAEISSHKNGPQTKIRLQVKTAEKVMENRAGILDTLHKAFDSGALSATGNSPWVLTDISTKEDAERAYSVVKRLATETLPLTMEQSQRVTGEVGLKRSTSIAEWIEQIRMLEGIASTLETFKTTIYDRSVQDMVIATASDEWRQKHGHSMKRSRRRALVKQAKDFVRPGVNIHDMHGALSEVAKQREVWRRYSADSDWPSLPDGMTMIRATAKEVDRQLEQLEKILPEDRRLRDEPIEELLGLVRTLASQKEVLDTQPLRYQLMRDLRNQGLGAFVEDFVDRKVPVSNIDAELDLAYTNFVFEQLIARNAILANASPAQVLAMVNRVRQLDTEHVLNLSEPVLRSTVRIMRSVARKNRDALVACDRLLASRKTAAIRDIATRHKDIIQTSRPVWVAPAVVVAEYVPQVTWADLLIIDNSEEMSLASVVSAVARGSQVVACGDVHRAREGSALEAFAQALPSITLPTLRAHHDDVAISFLHRLGYDEASHLPVAGKMRATGQRLTVVDGRGVPSPATGLVEATTAEVDAVVDAVVDHMLSRNNESLAVITGSQLHATRVRNAVDKAIEQNPALLAARRSQSTEPLVITDVTQIGGLRRDSVIFSLGFGKTVHGRVLHNFGALSTPEGMDHLIEAMLVPRHYMHVISSLAADEISVDDMNAKAPRMIKDLLDEVAKSSVDMTAEENRTQASPLLLDLEARLRKLGLSTNLYYGHGRGVRIPLVVGENDGDWRVAILTDDAAYMKEKSLRRRDRHMVEALNELGWLVTYCYSTSAFLDPQGEAERIASLLRVVATAQSPEVSGESLNFGADSWETFNAVTDAVVPEELANQDEGKDDATRSEPLRGGIANVTTKGEQKPEPKERTQKPNIQPGLPLAAYSDDQLDDMVAWIASDGIERTETDYVKELRNELDIRRRGAQIDAVLGNVVRRSGYVHQ